MRVMVLLFVCLIWCWNIIRDISVIVSKSLRICVKRSKIMKVVLKSLVEVMKRWVLCVLWRVLFIESGCWMCWLCVFVVILTVGISARMVSGWLRTITVCLKCFFWIMWMVFWLFCMVFVWRFIFKFLMVNLLIVFWFGLSMWCRRKAKFRLTVFIMIFRKKSSISLSMSDWMFLKSFVFMKCMLGCFLLSWRLIFMLSLLMMFCRVLKISVITSYNWWLFKSMCIMYFLVIMLLIFLVCFFDVVCLMNWSIWLIRCILWVLSCLWIWCIFTRRLILSTVLICLMVVMVSIFILVWKVIIGCGIFDVLIMVNGKLCVICFWIFVIGSKNLSLMVFVSMAWCLWCISIMVFKLFLWVIMKSILVWLLMLMLWCILCLLMICFIFFTKVRWRRSRKTWAVCWCFVVWLVKVVLVLIIVFKWLLWISGLRFWVSGVWMKIGIWVIWCLLWRIVVMAKSVFFMLNFMIKCLLVIRLLFFGWWM